MADRIRQWNLEERRTMKYINLSDVLNFSLDEVLSSFWHRYPNPKSGHVVSVDTLSARVRRDGCLVTKRLIKKKNSVRLPSWGDRIAPKWVFVVEESIINRQHNTIQTYTRNIGASGAMCLFHEKATYREKCDVEGNSVVELERQAFIKSFTRFVGGTIESIMANGYKRKTAPGSLQGFNYVLTKMFRPHELSEDKTLGERIKDSTHKFKDTTEQKLHNSKEKFLEKKEQSKEKLMASKERMKERAEKSKEYLKERSEKSREKLREKKEKTKERLDNAKNIFKKS